MLQGIRVIDFTQYLPGPYASLRLADFGAEVIKVEPLSGDPARKMHLNNASSLFEANNRNKKSIALNLKTDQGKNIALNLIEQADVVLEGFRPGVMTNLGLNYEQVSLQNRKIVYLSLTGFGQNSSLPKKGSHDLNYLAISGLLSQLNDNKNTPIQPSVQFADLIGGITASEAILAALIKRERTGKGTYIDLAMTDSVFSLLTNQVIITSQTGYNQGLTILNGQFANYKIYKTKDQRYMTLGALEFKFWKNFCQAVNRPEWIEAYMHELYYESKIYKEVEELFLNRTLKEWIEVGEKHDCCLFPVLNVEEASKSNYIRERSLVQEQDGKLFVKTVANPTHQPPHITKHVGSHTEEILRDLLNKNEEEILNLQQSGIVR